MFETGSSVIVQFGEQISSNIFRPIADVLVRHVRDAPVKSAFLPEGWTNSAILMAARFDLASKSNYTLCNIQSCNTRSRNNMATSIDRNFLPNTDISRTLCHRVAANLQIIDCHSHLQQSEIVGRKRFRNVTELWLAGDHYKWQLMRSAGLGEYFITGTRSDEAKFSVFCNWC